MTTMSKRPVMPDVMRSVPFVLSGENARSLARATESWLATTVGCQQELTAFVSMRLGKDGEALRAIVGCKNPADVTVIQSRWIEETMRDYGTEMSKLVSLCSKSMNLGSRAGD
jgi:hypothetical protein